MFPSAAQRAGGCGGIRENIRIGPGSSAHLYRTSPDRIVVSWGATRAVPIVLHRLGLEANIWMRRAGNRLEGSYLDGVDRVGGVVLQRSPAGTSNVITPLQALCLAERCALLSGRDIDLVMNAFASWTGVRWGELQDVEGWDT